MPCIYTCFCIVQHAPRSDDAKPSMEQILRLVKKWQHILIHLWKFIILLFEISHSTISLLHLFLRSVLLSKLTTNTVWLRMRTASNSNTNICFHFLTDVFKCTIVPMPPVSFYSDYVINLFCVNVYFSYVLCLMLFVITLRQSSDSFWTFLKWYRKCVSCVRCIQCHWWFTQRVWDCFLTPRWLFKVFILKSNNVKH